MSVEHKIVGEIGPGMLILIGISITDGKAQADYLVQRISRLRIFEDAHGKMNRDIQEAGGGLLVVPNFTLYGDCRKGRRPSFDGAMRPAEARVLFEYFVEKLAETGIPVQTGVFGADMQVSLVNDGPITFVLDTPADPAEPSPERRSI